MTSCDHDMLMLCSVTPGLTPRTDVVLEDLPIGTATLALKKMEVETKMYMVKPHRKTSFATNEARLTCFVQSF